MIGFGVGKDLAGGRILPGILSDKIKMTILGKLGVNESSELKSKSNGSATVLETGCFWSINIVTTFFPTPYLSRASA